MVDQDALKRVREQIWKLQHDAAMPDRQRQDLTLHLMGLLIDLIEAVDSSYAPFSKPDRKNKLKKSA